MKLTPDLFIVGAGPVGCLIAEQAAHSMGWSSLVIDRRRHVAGNCYDHAHASGVLVHRYGPHYFRTNDQNLVQILSRHTDWIPGDYRVQSLVRGQHFPFPINLTTLEMFFGRAFSAESAEAFLGQLREPIDDPRNSEEFVVSRVGRELYEAFYRGYTQKQWGRPASELPPEVCGRIPVRLNRDENYVDHAFRMMPAGGYTAMFEKMLKHSQIELRLGVDFRQIREAVAPRVATVYCGPMDEFFDFQLGRLEWRSLDFEFTHSRRQFEQPCVQINHPDLDRSSTRSVEIKHVTNQIHDETVVATEFPKSSGEPYYPIPTAANLALQKAYVDLARRSGARVYFSGRLAQYRYLNMDEAMLGALETFARIRTEWEQVRNA